MDRREFVKNLALGTGCIVLLPAVTACAKKGAETPDDVPTEEAAPAPATTDATSQPVSASDIPATPPEGWDPIAYNKERGLGGAIPQSYHESISGADGDAKHLGKHLPYVPADIPAEAVPAGFLAVMWGDPAKGHAKHPNADRNESNNNEGHWYNWIRVRKAVDGDAEELQSEYNGWPQLGDGVNGQYAVQGGGDITADGGKNTIYLAAIPADCQPGDTIRIHAHCLTHGEYVDFLTL